MTEKMQRIDQEILLSTGDTLNMLDTLLEKWDKDWWDDFYADTERNIPFMTEKPDENLADFVQNNPVEKGASLDIGCGNGRNSIYLSKHNYNSTGIDISEESIKIAVDYSNRLKGHVDFVCGSFFDHAFKKESFDLIHDSGCLHHIKPHRRAEYLSKVKSLLKDGGHFTLTCFNLDGGANISDHDVYKKESMSGGLGFSKSKMVKVLEPYFEIIEIRKMRNMKGKDYFGLDICWAVTMKKSQ